jgi:hypothetical protein
MENDEKKYEDVIKVLKGLHEVKAPENFEADLQRKINSEKFSKEEKKSFWQNIFLPSRLIPSLGVIATAIVIFFVVDSNSEEMDDPFLIEPRVREDIFVVTEYKEIEKKQDEFSKPKSSMKDEPVLEKRRDENELKYSDDKMISGREKSGNVEGLSDEINFSKDQDLNAGSFSAVVESTETLKTETPQPTGTAKPNSDMATEQIITKEELNFRQVQLTEEEQKTVNELKTQVQSLEKTNKSQK